MNIKTKYKKNKMCLKKRKEFKKKIYRLSKYIDKTK